MSPKYFVVFISLAIIFISCDPGVAVVIRNESNSDKQIQAIYPEQILQRTERDSLYAYKTSDKNSYMFPVIVPLYGIDTAARTYSFVLRAGYETAVEGHLGVAPSYGWVFIIDGTDTVVLKRKDTTFSVKRAFPGGGTWTYKIKPKN